MRYSPTLEDEICRKYEISERRCYRNTDKFLEAGS